MIDFYLGLSGLTDWFYGRTADHSWVSGGKKSSLQLSYGELNLLSTFSS